jgi:uncharacterized protein
MKSSKHWRCHLWAPTPDALLLSSWVLAFGAALGGGIHCAVMCGPLRLLTPSAWGYQSGRLAGYLVLGAASGSIGMLAPVWIWLPIFFLVLLLSFSPKQISWLKPIRAKLLSLAKVHPFFLGLSAAILPCGLLHAWVGVAALAQNPIYGASLLFTLWLGSLPSLEFAPILLRKIQPWRSKNPKVFTLILLLMVSAPLLMRMGVFHSHGKESTKSMDKAKTHSCH